MSLTIDDRTKAEVDTMQKRKDKVFISRMVETLTKLEIKYLAPRRNTKRRLSTRKQKNRPTIPKELASDYHVLSAPDPVELTALETFPHVTWNDEKFKSAIPNPESCPVLSCSPHRELYVDLVNFANVPNPNVSSNKASTEANDDQSDIDVVKSVNTSDESNTSSFISLPLCQGSPIYHSLVSFPSPPTARKSSTTDLLLELACDVLPRMPAAPLLPTLSPTRPSVIRCPAGTCDEQSIYNNLLQVDDVSLEPNEDIIDQVPIGNHSPPVPSPGDGPVVLQDEETVPVPPPLTLSVKTILSAGCVELTTGLYTGIVKKERELGCMAERARMLGCHSFRPGRRETRRAPRRRWRMESAGVRQTHIFIVFQIVFVA